MFENSDIRAVIFDLDGTLIETEHLKARAYADLVGSIKGLDAPELGAIDLYQSRVGSTDMMICEAMIEEFSLASLLDPGPTETVSEALHRQRMELYRATHGAPEMLRQVIYEHNVHVARSAAEEGLSVGVATMSYSDEARRVLTAIGLGEIISTVVGVDDVANPKPSPDAFLLAMKNLGVEPGECLIFEDSARGAHAAIASGARWICVATEFSTDSLRSDGAIDNEWIAWSPKDVAPLLARRIKSTG